MGTRLGDDCESTKQSVLDHELWATMREVRLDHASTANFMVGVWPFIERFPGFMALNLLKTRYGRSLGDDLARRWLVRNIRVEQNHAEYWLNWAEGAGVPRSEVLNTRPAHGTQTWPTGARKSAPSEVLAAGMMATNYAIEGVTGEWARPIYESAAYAESFPARSRTGKPALASTARRLRRHPPVGGTGDCLHADGHDASGRRGDSHLGECVSAAIPACESSATFACRHAASSRDEGSGGLMVI